MNRKAAALAACVAGFLFLAPAPSFSQDLPREENAVPAGPQAYDNPYHPLPLDPNDTSAFARSLRDAIAARDAFLLSREQHNLESKGAPPTEEEKATALKATRSYIEAMRLADFSKTEMLRQLFAPMEGAPGWDSLADACGEREHFIQALVQQLAKCPPGQAAFATVDLFSKIYLELAWWSDLDSMRALASTLENRQRHLLRYFGLDDILRGLKLRKANPEAASLAQAIVLAKLHEPGSPDASQHLPRVLEYGNDLLETALLDHAEDFIAQLDKAVALEPEDQSRIRFWLKARAAFGTLHPDHLALLQKWGPLTRITTALDTISVAHEKQPPDIFDPWMREVLPLMLKLDAEFDEPENLNLMLRDIARDFALLKSPAMAAFARQHLHGWIEGLQRTGEDDFPPEHCEFVASLAKRFGSPNDELEVFNRWMGMGYLNAQSKRWELEGHEESMARAAAAASPELAARLSARLTKLWMNLCQQGCLPDVEPTRNVFRLLLATSQHETFNTLGAELERAEKAFIPEVAEPNQAAPSSPSHLRGLVVEMRALHGLLLHQPHHLPLAIAWTRAAGTPETPPQIAWEFAVPIAAPPDFPDDQRSWPGVTSPSWQPGHGLRSPLLEALSGTYDIRFEIGDRPDHCQKIAEATHASAHGVISLSQPIKTCGYLRSVVRDRQTGEEFASPARPYSLEPPVLATGPEPIPTHCGGSYVVPAAKDTDTSVRLSAIDPQQTYLLTCWVPHLATADGDEEYPQEPRMISFVTSAGNDLNRCIGRYLLNSSVQDSNPNPMVSASFHSEFLVPSRDLDVDLMGMSTSPLFGHPLVSHIAEISERGSERPCVPLYQLRPFYGAQAAVK
jgi:hypothetical protein